MDGGPILCFLNVFCWDKFSPLEVFTEVISMIASEFYSQNWCPDTHFGNLYGSLTCFCSDICEAKTVPLAMSWKGWFNPFPHNDTF